MNENSLMASLDRSDSALQGSLSTFRARTYVEEVGRIHSTTQGVVKASGLLGVKYEELVVLRPGMGRTQVEGLVLDILPELASIALLRRGESLRAGDEVVRTGVAVETLVGEALLGRVVDPLGLPLDGNGPIAALTRYPIQRPAPAIIRRAPVTTPLETGLKVVDALIPIGRGQRELILGDRNTGKSSLALDAVINQKGKDVLCIYCLIGQRGSGAAKTAETLRSHGAMPYSILVVAEGDDPPGLQFIAPYAACSMAEYFMEQGRDALVVFDDLTRHARAYRQLSLLFRRPPGREAYPGDIFYAHSRLLERSTRLRPEYGGGSLTALPIIETEAQNISAYIPTNLISITDGQIFLSPDLFRKGLLPAVDVGQSVSRVGGKAQYPAYRKVTGHLRLTYSQFQELEAFARFGTRLDERTGEKLEHGRRVREVLKQDRFSPLTAAEQIATLYAVTRNLFDRTPLERIGEAQARVFELIRGDTALTAHLLRARESDPIFDDLHSRIEKTLKGFRTFHGNGATH